MDERKAFEAHILAYTGRDMAYHASYQTTGIESAWLAWQAATKQERERAAKVCERERMVRGGEVFAAEIRRG